MNTIENLELNNEWGFFIDTEIYELNNKKKEENELEEDKKQYNKKESKYIKKISSFLYYGTTFLISFSLTYCICCIL